MSMLGRDRERGQLALLVESALEGRSASLVLRGEAGIGKTMLLDDLAGQAAGMRVLRLTGVESDAELAFAALQQLCAPLLELSGALPAPQARALGVAFGTAEGVAPERFLVGLAVLNLMAEAARERPLLCLVDDAQWLDRASALVLAFVARRLSMDSILLVVATRETRDEFTGIAQLELGALSDAHARELLIASVPGPLDSRVRDVIVAEAHGNPFALLELPRMLTPTRLAGGYGVLDAAGGSSAVEQGIRDQAAALPDDARQLVLLAAADPEGEPLLLWRAARLLGIGAEAAAAAQEAGMLRVGTRVTFRHPLLRSTVYRAAPLERRREAHRALAAAIDPESQPDLRAWHRAQAAVGPDETVADELQSAAGRARARGGAAASAAFLERAAQLTLDPLLRAERQLGAAEAKLDAGGIEAAELLVAAAEAGSLDKAQSARATLLRGHAAFARSFGRDAPPLLLRAARQFEIIDDRRARETFLEAFSAALLAGRLAVGAGVSEVAEAVRAAVPLPDEAGPSDLLLEGFARFVADGPGAGSPLLRAALAQYQACWDIPMGESLRWLWLAGHAAGLVWDYDAWDECSARLLRDARAAGALAVMPVALSTRAGTLLFAGALEDASALAAEEAVIEDVVGSRIAPYGTLGYAAFAGQEARALELSTTGRRDAEARGEGVGVNFVDWAMALLYNGVGRYAHALEAARRAAEDDTVQRFRNWGLVELVEAATRSGHPREAADALVRLERVCSPESSSWAAGVLARSRALAGSGEAADDLYRRAITCLEDTRLRPDLARARLVYGEWLRRERRVREARSLLRSAHAEFADMGMTGFAERARAELAAAGEHASRSEARRGPELTAQQTQICRLVAEGAGNAEIAARLFISVRTVEYHLSKLFRKLKVTSRTQLAREYLGAVRTADSTDSGEGAARP